MLTRREFTFSATMGAAAFACEVPAAERSSLPMIVDTHQHLWNRDKLRLPWLEKAPAMLARNYVTEDYLAATKGLDLQAVYMEVDVDPAQRWAEVEQVVALTKDKATRTVGAVVGGRPASAEFADDVARLKKLPQIKGVRQVLHSDAPQGFCLQADFVRGIKLLGDTELSFDLCMRPSELGDGAKLAKICPNTRLIVDHCGNADPKAFLRKSEAQPDHQADDWRRAMDTLAAQPNVLCKISGIVARVPKEWSSDTLAPIVNHCLDAFGPERVIFGSDWPVCLLGAPLRAWVDALAEVIAERPQEVLDKLWNGNARRYYAID